MILEGFTSEVSQIIILFTINSSTNMMSMAYRSNKIIMYLGKLYNFIGLQKNG